MTMLFKRPHHVTDEDIKAGILLFVVKKIPSHLVTQHIFKE